MEKTISHTPKRTETKQIYCATEVDTTGSFERRSHLRTAPTRQYVLTHSNTFRENKSRTNLYKQTHIHHIVFIIVSLCWYVVFICALTRAKPWRGKAQAEQEREEKRMRLSEKYWPKKIIIHTSTRKTELHFTINYLCDVFVLAEVVHVWSHCVCICVLCAGPSCTHFTSISLTLFHSFTRASSLPLTQSVLFPLFQLWMFYFLVPMLSSGWLFLLVNGFLEPVNRHACHSI